MPANDQTPLYETASPETATQINARAHDLRIRTHSNFDDGATLATDLLKNDLWVDRTNGKIYIARTDGDTTGRVLFPDLAVPHGGLTRVQQIRVMLPASFLGGTGTVNIFAAYGACTVVGFALLSDTATSGSNSGNKRTFQLTNLGIAGAGTATMLATAKSTVGAEIAVDTAYQLAPAQNLGMVANEVLRLTVTVTGVPTALDSAVVSGMLYMVAA